MIAWRLFISACSILSYWLVTHKQHRRIGLWFTLVTELQWSIMFVISGLYELLPSCTFFVAITIKRLTERGDHV